MRILIIFALLLGLTMMFFSSEMAFAEVTISDREKISSLNSTTFDGSSLGIEAGNLFGYHIENIGDLDGDGINDLAVSQYQDDFPNVFSKTRSGSLSILFMNENGTVKNVNKILHDNSTSGLGTTCIDDYDNQVDDDRAGFEASAYLGNLINGNPTLAVSAAFDNITSKWSGAIYILELTTGGVVNSCTRITDNQNGFMPPADKYSEIEPLFGFNLIATDLNGDGTKELITTAVAENNLNDDIWSLFLRDNSGGGNVVDSFQYVNATAFGLVELFVDSGSAIDEDKKIIIGISEVNESGGVFIINFNSDGTLNGIPTQINGTEVNPLIPSDQRFGSGVTVVGDLDGDGILDIMVGNEAGDNTNNHSGEAYILFMNSDDTVKESQKISNESEFTRTGETPFAQDTLFGQGMVVWKESDGQTVIAMGSPSDNTGSADSGAMYLFYIGESPVTATSSGDGDDNKHLTAPTFGMSWHRTSFQMVECGFTINGICIDITNNWHTDFEIKKLDTGIVHNFGTKMFAQNGGLWFSEIAFGIPEVGKFQEPESLLTVFYNPDKSLDRIEIKQEYPLVTIKNVTTSQEFCRELNDSQCYQTDFELIFSTPLRSNIFGIQAVDLERRNMHPTYLNEGIEIVGPTFWPNWNQ